MALRIVCDQVQRDSSSGVYTGFFYVEDDANPGVRLKETTVQGSNQAEIQTELERKYSAWKTKYDQEQSLIQIGNDIAAAVIIAVDGGE